MKRILTTAGLVALGAACVHAESTPGTLPTDKPWSVSATLRGFYDDNTTLASRAAARRSSFGFEVNPTFTVGHSTDQTTLGARYSYSFRDYLNRPGSTDYDQTHEFNAWLMHAFSQRFSVDAVDTFTISREPTVQDPSLGVARSNGDSVRNQAEVSLHTQATRLLEVVLGYRNTYVDYRDPGYSVLLDRVEHNINLELKWQAMPETYALFGYEYGMVNFLNSVGKARDSHTHRVYAGVEHKFVSNLTGSVKAGADFFALDNAARYSSFSGSTNVTSSTVSPFIEASMRYVYLAGSFVEVGFKHERNQTDVNAVDEESSSVYSTISHRITPKLTGTLTGRYNHGEFFTGSSSSTTKNNEDTVLLGIDFKYQFTRNFSSQVGYNYDGICSDIDGRGYDRNRIFWGVTVSY
ncbi:MAG: hypothetical protein RLZZ350_557 [Verrucomicrobiota bacterium]|jgi:hypothetical protein